MVIDPIDESFEEAKRPIWKVLLGFVFILFVLFLLINYWIVPDGAIFNKISSNGKYFSCSEFGFQNASMQFYPNMRFTTPQISYRIDNCAFEKKVSLRNAFDILENQTILDFSEVEEGEDIFVTCSETYRHEDQMFIAGEGGPTSYVLLDNFSVIKGGSLLLYKTANCEYPVVEMHEIFHVLGFNHSANRCNIMYPSSSCAQGTGTDMIDEINRIYSYENLPDLSFSGVESFRDRNYLDLNISVTNNGLATSPNSTIKIFGNNKLLEIIPFNSIKIGEGLVAYLHNLQVDRKLDKINLVIDSDFEEFDKENNEFVLEVN